MKTFVIFFISIFIYLVSFSQEYDPYTYQDIKPKSTLKDKIFFGGGFGLQLGSVTNITVMPEVGYRFTDKFTAGTGLYYMYTSISAYNYSDNVYGGKIFSRYYVVPDFFIAGEYESLNIADYDLYTGYYTGGRIWVQGLLLGGGWRQKIGEHFAILTTLMYNVLEDDKTPYSNPVFKISFIY
ncbi:MAG: hypothetical protein GXO50_05090 [Chlorobi bacterium]|nr:hypothetical protein [Chlorobiota bacterium]